jgi:hypothetical protein
LRTPKLSGDALGDFDDFSLGPPVKNFFANSDGVRDVPERCRGAEEDSFFAKSDRAKGWR